MRKIATIISFWAFAFLLPVAASHTKPAAAAVPAPSNPPTHAAQQAADSDQTLRAMHDEMERNRARLQLPGVEKPFYLEYRLLDVDVRAVTASFGDLVSSTTTRNRFMSVDARIGDYHLDSSNFVSEDGFQGFLGSTGEVGIDHDYNSLRQDLWLATDQAYKEAATQLSEADGDGTGTSTVSSDCNTQRHYW